uniref:Nuclear receptor domain-containing protein n=1 Tax=Bursaphelenchus xylophilus TaxID=6326 RepID=A0A1I7S7P1_BURXY
MDTMGHVFSFPAPTFSLTELECQQLTDQPFTSEYTQLPVQQSTSPVPEEKVVVPTDPVNYTRCKHTEANARCLVCGEAVLYHNFGISACNGCAAFFRRTILQRKKYICREFGNCQIYMTKNKRRCAYCRFEKCVKVGMNVSKLMTRLTRENDDPLRQLMYCHRGIYTSRKRNAIIQLGSLVKLECMAEQPRTSASLIQATLVEISVMKEFLRTSNFIPCNMYDTKFEGTMCSTLLHTWLTMHSIFATRFNKGYTSRKLYFVDNSYLHVTEESVIDYYSTNKMISDPKFVGINSMPLLNKVLEAAKKLDQFHVDEHELLILTMLVVIRASICRMGQSKYFMEWQNRLFKEIHQFYSGIYVDIPKRLGELMLCLEAIETADRNCDKLAVLVQLNYRKTEDVGYKLYVRGHDEVN